MWCFSKTHVALQGTVVILTATEAQDGHAVLVPQLGFAKVSTSHSREHLMFVQDSAKGQRVPQLLLRSLADRILFLRLQGVLALATTSRHQLAVMDDKMMTGDCILGTNFILSVNAIWTYYDN